MSRRPNQSDPPRIIVYPFASAPEHLRDLSRNGGDEDWIAIVPPSIRDAYIPWLEEGSSFGVCCVDEYEHPSPFYRGWKVLIGSHS